MIVDPSPEPAPSPAGASDRRPVVTLDFDGVLCEPPFGRNLGISRTFLDPAAEAPAARLVPRWLGDPLDRARFAFRRPLPGIGPALADLHQVRTVVVLTGRRSSPLPWLRRYGLLEAIDRVVMNAGPWRSPHFKLHAIEELGAVEHVDDDGRTAQLLAERSAARIYLRDWPRNRGLAFAPSVTRVADLAEYVRLVRTQISGSRTGQ